MHNTVDTINNIWFKATRSVERLGDTVVTGQVGHLGTLGNESQIASQSLWDGSIDSLSSNSIDLSNIIFSSFIKIVQSFSNLFIPSHSRSKSSRKSGSKSSLCSLHIWLRKVSQLVQDLNSGFGYLGNLNYRIITWEPEPANFKPKRPESEKLFEKAWTLLMNTFLSRMFLLVKAEFPVSELYQLYVREPHLQPKECKHLGSYFLRKRKQHGRCLNPRSFWSHHQHIERLLFEV